MGFYLLNVVIVSVVVLMTGGHRGNEKGKRPVSFDPCFHAIDAQALKNSTPAPEILGSYATGSTADSTIEFHENLRFIPGLARFTVDTQAKRA
jgi:hypothetical protein